MLLYSVNTPFLAEIPVPIVLKEVPLPSADAPLALRNRVACKALW